MNRLYALVFLFAFACMASSLPVERREISVDMEVNGDARIEPPFLRPMRR
ncbi:hypothetical protein AX14_006858 [Amanita brunnescens Koide BX004]|nr:hypothetical protein AX14_006858 [Amanita brunnescens Koide BX004]